MSLDWGGFFTGLGRGAADYGQMWQQQNQFDEEKKLREAGLQLQRDQLAQQAEHDRQEQIRLTRGEYMDRAQHQSDQYARQGVMVSPDFEQNAMNAQLPQASTTNGDVGSMAINSLRNAGQADNKQWASGIPDAVNQGWKTGAMSTPIQGGGAYMLDQGVKASLTNAESQRKTTIEAAKIGAPDRRPKYVQEGYGKGGFAQWRADQLVGKREPWEETWRAKRMAELTTPKAALDLGGDYVYSKAMTPEEARVQIDKEMQQGVEGGGGAAGIIDRYIQAENGQRAGTAVSPDPQINEAKAQRWDELTKGGMNGTLAHQQVEREFRNK